MSWSLVETRAMATKATRGAGYSWGLAEEAGFAVHWLQLNGAPGVEALARLLEWVEKPGNRCSPVWSADKGDDPAWPVNPLELATDLKRSRTNSVRKLPKESAHHAFSFFLRSRETSLSPQTTTTTNGSRLRPYKADQITNKMSFLDKMKKAGKSVVDAGAKTMLKVSEFAVL